MHFAYPIFAVCEGSSSCTQQLISSIVAFALVLAIAVVLLSRFVLVNARRRARGLPTLKWSAIADARSKGGDLVGGDANVIESGAKELRRQIMWERQQATQEMARMGRSFTRSYCKVHDRHCKEPIAIEHPPGGIDNERAPADWEPV